jgi:soluble cytochrome b562
MVLITYNYQKHGETHNSYHYAMAKSAIEWIEEMQEYKDGWYVLVNVLPVTDKWAEEHDGGLGSM